MRQDTFRRTILSIAVITNTAVFILLSMVHFYWAFGGRLWYDEVLPTSTNGLHRLNPTTTAAIIIAFGLLFFAFLTAGNHAFFHRYSKQKYFRYAALFIALVFLFRAIGDFKFIGFFKTVKGTRFGINDTEIFSPLCLFVSLLSLLIFFGSRKKA